MSEMVNQGKVWTDEELNLLRENYIKGDTIEDLSKKHKRSKNAIINKLKFLKIYKTKNNVWTEEEIKILKEIYGYGDWDNILSLLPRHNKDSIISKAYKLKIKNKSYKWTDEESFILQKEYNKGTSIKEISKILNKTESSVSGKAGLMGLKRVFLWQDWEKEYLKENYSIKTMEEICGVLNNRKRKNIINYAKKLNLKNNQWQPHEDEFIKENYIKMSDVEMSEKLNNRTWRAVKWRRSILGLERKGYGGWGQNYTALDGSNCLSIGEFNITNYFIKNNIYYEKEVSYKNIIEEDNSLRRFDWIVRNIENNMICVEFFGMSTNKKKKSKSIIEYEKRKNKKIIDCDKNNIPLICIYENDLLFNMKGFKEKLLQFNIIKSID